MLFKLFQYREENKKFLTLYEVLAQLGFPSGSAVKNPPVSAGDLGSVPGQGRFCGEGSGNPLQYAYLGNTMDRRAWRTVVHGVAELGTAERLTKESEMQYLDAISKTTE